MDGINSIFLDILPHFSVNTEKIGSFHSQTSNVTVFTSFLLRITK